MEENDNLICYFNKLSQEFINKTSKCISDKTKKQYVRHLSKIALNTWKNNQNDPRIDKNETTWKASILIEDVAYGFEQNGHVELKDKILNNLHIIENGEFTVIDDILLFLLLSSEPNKSNDIIKHPFTLSGHNKFLKTENPFAVDFTVFNPNPENQTKTIKDFITPKNSLLKLVVNNTSFHDNISDLFSNAQTVQQLENFNCKYLVPLKEISAVNDEISPLVPKSKCKLLNEVEYQLKLTSGKTKTMNKRVIKHINNRALLTLTRTNVPLKEIQMSDYLLHLKYLICGVNTSSFYFSEDLHSFCMVDGLYCNGMNSKTLQEYSKKFLDLGTFYYHLNCSALSSVKISIEHCGIIYKTFWENLLQQLQNHCKDVVNMSLDTSMIVLHEWAERKHALFQTLADLCCLKETENTLPRGGALLNHLFHYAEKITEDFIKVNILSLLINCCNIYIKKLLDIWVFRGELNVKFNDDFFVSINQESSTKFDRSRYFIFDVQKENVPFFLLESFEDVVTCGKSCYLLNIFDSQNIFTRLLQNNKYPGLQLGFNYQDLVAIESTCKDYYEKMILECGQPVTMLSIKQDEKINEKKQEENIKMIQKEINEKRIKEKITKIREPKNINIKQLEELKLQIEENNKRNDERKRAEIAMDNKLIDDNKTFRELELTIIEEEKKRLTNIYEQAIADEQNSNTMLDSEGNILTEMDEKGSDSPEVVSNVADMFMERKVIAELNRKKCMEVTYETNIKQRKGTDEAERIKQKVLGSEYNIISMDTDVKPLFPSRKLSEEAERNKKKMLGTEFDIQEHPFIVPNEAVKTNTLIEEKVMNLKVTEEVNLEPKETPKTDLQQKKSPFDVNVKTILEQNDPKYFPWMFDETHFKEFPGIEDSYSFQKFVSRSLKIGISIQSKLLNSYILRHFFVNENYLSHLRSLRSYFLLHDGEFSRSLTWNLFNHLAKSSDLRQFFDKSALSNIVNEALSYSITKENDDNVSFQVFELPQKFDPTCRNVLKPFQLSYAIKWPLNIIFTDKALTYYRQVFHFMVNLKRVRWNLNETFLHLKSLTKETSTDIRLLMNSPQYHKVMIYRHGIILYIILLEEHICNNGPETAWINFMSQMESAKNLDDLYAQHVEYVKDIKLRCFLGKVYQNMQDLINKLVQIGLQFHYVVKSDEWYKTNTCYIYPRYNEVESIFNNFCETTLKFYKALEKGIHRPSVPMRVHVSLLEQIRIKFQIKP